MLTPENVLLSVDGLIRKCERFPAPLEYLLTVKSIVTQMLARVDAAIERHEHRATPGADSR